MRASLLWLGWTTGAPLSAHVQAGWRFWIARDGLQESYTQSIGIAPDGSVWVRHGAVAAMSVLNGYSTNRIPEPRSGSTVVWSLLARVNGGLRGDAWTVEDGALKQFWNQRWNVRYIQPQGDRLLAAVPVDDRRVWVLFPGRIAEFDSRTGSWKVLKESSATSVGSFSRMVRGFGRDVWVTGERGAGHLELSPPAGAYRWTECDTSKIGMVRIQRRLPQESGELSFAGTLRGGGRAAGRWRGSTLEILLQSADSVQAWRGADDTMGVAGSHPAPGGRTPAGCGR